MNAIIFLYWTSFKNRVRKALRKPVTYIYAFFILVYIVMMFISGRLLINDFKGQGNKWFFVITCCFAVFTIANNLITYSEKKGLLFTKSDVHFLFQSPMNPKKILLYAQVRNMFAMFFTNIIFLLIGVTMLHVEAWRILLYLFVFYVAENVMEVSLMILIYGNEKLSDTSLRIIRNLLKVLVGIFILYVLNLVIKNGISIHVAELVLCNSVIQCIPLLGWIVAVLELIFIKATVVNVTCTILYCILLAIVLFLMAHMKCTGQYFEDAMKFADDYTEAKEKAKKGETVFSFKKEKYKEAAVQYKGTGAKALFYRQLLEYKKSKWFIFGKSSLFHLLIGIGISVFLYQNPEIAGEQAWMFIGGVSAYIIILTSGFSTKWQMELTSPYTFLIPDTNMRKMWYSSVIEHIRAFSNGVLSIVPPAIYVKMSPITTILLIIAYVCFSANKTYAGIVCEEVLGNILGQGVKQTLRVFLVTTALGISILAFSLANLSAGKNAGFLAFIIITVLFTFILGLLASLMFDKMERND